LVQVLRLFRVSKDLLVMSLKSFVNNKPEWDAFCEEVDVWIMDQHKKLEQTENQAELYRAQGAIGMLRKMKYLRDKVNGI
jgi:hypothetical protein